MKFRGPNRRGSRMPDWVDSDPFVYSVGTVAVVGLVFGLDYLAGWVSDWANGASDAQKYLQRSGYSDVRYQDTDHLFVGFSGCDKNDTVGYDFKAKGPTGSPTEVLVCAGIFKSFTIRDGQ